MTAKKTRGYPEPLEVWERRTDESDPAWEAFVTYRDQQPGARSLTRVARTLSKSRPLITRWSGRYGWPMRAAGFDREQDKAWVAHSMVLRRENAERDVRLAGVMLGKVVQRLQSIDAEKLSPRDCVMWVDVATKIARLALGDPTERVAVGEGMGTADPGLLSPEERRVRLEQLLREGERRLKSVPTMPSANAG